MGTEKEWSVREKDTNCMGQAAVQTAEFQNRRVTATMSNDKKDSLVIRTDNIEIITDNLDKTEVHLGHTEE